MKIRYLGHSAFQIIGSKNVVIDPFLSGNPMAADLNGKPDLILVTHAHGDHTGDAVDLSKRYDAPIVCMYGPKRSSKGSGTSETKDHRANALQHVPAHSPGPRRVQAARGRWGKGGDTTARGRVRGIRVKYRSEEPF